MKVLLAICSLLPFALGSYLPPTLPPQCHVSNGGWGEWSHFEPCSKTCGSGGLQKRYRFCDSPIPKYGGADCVGDKIEVKPCDGYTECPIDGGWGPWVSGECSEDCGGGVLTHTRECNSPTAQHCGKPCEGDSVRTEACNTHHCPIPGGWSEWSCTSCKYKDSQCVQNCTRTCNNPPPQYGGAQCVGKSFDLDRQCGSGECQDFPVSACGECKDKAIRDGIENGWDDFVGLACRVDNSHCDGLENGMQEMYPADHWFFLHCSPDGPWCKPCATRNLVYNANCGACEITRDGPCTGTGR